MPNFIIYIEDLLFWIITGGILTFTIYTINSGTVRLYQIIGLILGAFIYFASISRAIFRFINHCKRKVMSKKEKNL